MASKLPRLKDRAPVYGMNSRDDPKDIKDGEVVSLINAYPGNPPIPRKGCRHNRIIDTDDYDYASHAIAFITTSGNRYAVVWIKDGTDYHLVKINLETTELTILGTATGLTDPAFRFIHIFDYIYAVCDEDMTWDGSGQTTRHKIIEIGDTGEDDVVREMCINVAASIADLTKITGTTFNNGYMSYAFSFIRHTVDAAFGSDGNPQMLTAFYPGVNEGPEDLNNRVVVGDAGNFGVNFPLYLSGETPENYLYAIEQGATHIRIYRTRKQTTSDLASEATHFFCMDVPIPIALPSKAIESIVLASNDVRATIAAHGFASGNALFAEMDDTDLNGVHAITDEGANTIKLNGTSGQNYDAYAGNGKVSQTYSEILSIDLLSATNVRITTTAAHGLTTDDEIVITGITGVVGGNKVKYNYWHKRSTDGMWIVVRSWSGSWKGLNNATYTVTVIDATTIELQDTISDEYDYPFDTPATPDVPYAYDLYSKAEMVPPMVGGYIGRSFKSITAMETPENRIAVVTSVAHNLIDDYWVKLIDMESGAEELDDTSWQVEVIDSTSFYLVDSNTSGISPYVSGGSIFSSSSPLDQNDTVTDASLAGETAQLLTTPYSAGPKAGFCEYAKTRLWLFGLISTEKGRAYYSEVPGGAGATPIDAAHTYPQKFLSLFNYDYYIDFSVKKGYLPTGIKRLADDLFFFFEGEVYALFGSDPTLTSPTLISEEIGCAFPDTLIVGDLPIFGGQCLLYISNLGPAITKQGGETFLFTDFKIAELWPDVNRELYGDLDDQREHIIHHCAAEYWDNTWWVSYENNAGVKKIYAYYFNPELKFDPKVNHGPFQFDLAEV